MPERLGAEYVTEDGTREHPVMLHRAVLGSLERFLGVLIEQYAGKFPVWLAPVQVVVATITEDSIDGAKRIFDELQERGIRSEFDIRNEKISYKIREHSNQKVPYIFVVGKDEIATNTVSIRKLGSDEQRKIGTKEAIKEVESLSTVNTTS
jgi:threonyl-tRNA synthetase